MKIVIIGTCGHSGIIFRDIDKSTNAKIVGFSPGCKEEDISKRATVYNQYYPDIKIYDDYLQMIDELKPDIAAVGSYYYLNQEITMQLLKRGIHCISEKPSALTLEGLEELKEVYKTSGVEYVSMLEMRYSPLFLAAYNEIKKGSIGTPLMVTVQKTYKLGNRSFLFRNRNFYGGTIPYVGIHGIDLMLWIMDSPVETVFARHTREGNSNHQELESCAIVGLSFKNGTFGSANIDFLNPDKAGGHGDDRIRVAGDKGIIEVKEGKTTLVTNDNPPVSVDTTPSRFFFPDFVSHIKKEGTCLLSAEDSFYSTEVVLKARLSADEKKTINV
jgi:predicted dehydrogenase